MSCNAENRRPREISDKRGERLRSQHIRPLIAGALTVSLLLGGAFLSVGRFHSTPADVLDHPDNPITDDQSQAQVIESARQIVTLTGLRTASAGYALMSCKDRENPPYQGAIYLTFSLPIAARADVYFPAVDAKLVGHGWTEGLPPNNHTFAKTLFNDAVTLIIYRQDDDPRLGVLRIYGQCRNMTDHRHDTTAWADVTDQVTGPG